MLPRRTRITEEKEDERDRFSCNEALAFSMFALVYSPCHFSSGSVVSTRSDLSQS